MRGVVAVLASYGCLAVIVALFFAPGAHAAAIDRTFHDNRPALIEASAIGASMHEVPDTAC